MQSSEPAGAAGSACDRPFMSGNVHSLACVSSGRRGLLLALQWRPWHASVVLVYALSSQSPLPGFCLWLRGLPCHVLETARWEG